jgi:hypothetical protein
MTLYAAEVSFMRLSKVAKLPPAIVLLGASLSLATGCGNAPPKRPINPASGEKSQDSIAAEQIKPADKVNSENADGKAAVDSEPQATGGAESDAEKSGIQRQTNQVPAEAPPLCEKAGQIIATRMRFPFAISTTECKPETQELICQGADAAKWSGTATQATCIVDLQAPIQKPIDPVQRVTEKRVAYEMAKVPFGGTCISELQTRVVTDGIAGDWSGTYKEASCEAQAPADCGALKHSQYALRTRYKSASVPQGSMCVAEVQRQSCVNGALSPFDGSFTFESCQVLGKSSCGTVPHGGNQSRIRYQSLSVPFGNACKNEEQSRTCNDGTFGNWSGTFASSDCQVALPASCGALSHNQSELRVRFEAATVPFGNSCNVEEQKRTCDNGTLGSWSGSFSNASCQVLAPSKCGDIAHGQDSIRTRYQAASVPFGAVCKQEVQEQTCNNGTLTSWSGTYSQTACVVENALSCGSVPHLGKETRIQYEDDEVPFGMTCTPEDQTRTCTNGTLGNWSGTFSQGSCVVLPAMACGPILHGETTTRTQYDASTVPFGQQCKSEIQSQTCSNGSLSAWTGSYAFQACAPELPKNCTNLEHGKSEERIRFETATASAGVGCNAETQQRTCFDGTESAWSGSFTFESCQVVPE